jgi:protein involved in polysaccharide export with SLBB domain
VSIPWEEIFYVTGEVHAPGKFRFEKGMTLRRAISLAQGLTLNAQPQVATILRLDRATNSKHEIKVNILNVMNGKESDIPVMPDDLIFVPGARSVKTIRPFPRDLMPRGPVPPCVKGKPCIAQINRHDRGVN